MDTLRKKFRALITKLKHKKILRYLTIILLVLAIPLTVFLAQKQQEIRQRASENQTRITVSPPIASAGNTVTVSWGIEKAAPSMDDREKNGASREGSAAVGVSPTTVTRGGTVTFEWRYNGMTPQPTDYLEIFTSSGEHVGSIFMSGCGTTPGDNTPAEGSCTFNTSPIGPDTYVVKIIRNDTPLSQTSFTVTAESSFLLIPKAFAQTAFTGAETLQLFTTGREVKAVGRQIYLNCEEKTADTPPPTTPISSGTCQYPIAPEVPTGSYIFRMYASDGTTILGESDAFTVQESPNMSTRPGKFIVTFDKSVPQAKQIEIRDSVSTSIASDVASKEISPNSIVITSQPGQQEDIMNIYRNQPGVAEVIPDYLIPPLATPNDPLFPEQSGLQLMNVPTAWNSGQGQGIKIAILDMGISDHPDLKDNIGLQKDFWGTGLTPTSEHGTGVAGVAAATFNNNTGIAGIAGKSTIYNAKVGGDSYISTANVIEAIIWATDNNAKVISMSFGSVVPGGGGGCFAAYQNAMNYAWEHGVVLIGGAGNDGLENVTFFPAHCTHVIPVGATNSVGTTRAIFSNYGANVPIAAPGESQLTTLFNGTYGKRDGTSISAPYVAGVAALLLAKYPGISPDAVRDILYSTAKPLYGFSKGMVDAETALNAQVPTSTPIPTATPTPIQSSACEPRPPVKLQSVRDGDGMLKVTVSATSNPGFTNTLQSIKWNNLSNASIENMGEVAQGNQTSLATNTQSVTFLVKRITPGQSTTASITVNDACGAWNTFVGGGPSAF